MLLLFTLISTALAGKILIYNPTIGVSHVRFLGNLADLYIADGHEVTILSPVVDDHVDPIGTSNLKVKKIVYHSKYVNVEDWKTMDIKRPEFWTTPAPRGMSMSWDVWRCFINTTSNIYKGLLEDKKMLNYLIDQKFDLGVLETFELGGIGLFEILGIKANIVAAALGLIGHHYPLTGIPYFSSFVPDFLSSMDGEMIFMERLINLRTTIQLHFQLDEDVEILHRIFRKHYPNFPNIRELYQKRSAVVFTNTNEFTESPRLKTNMIQYVGGTNVRPPKPLPKELDEILELRESTVFVSFGSFVQACTMPLEMKIEILESFSRYPDVTFLWKYESHCENDSIPLKDYPNVITKDWWPQTDLLGDARVKGFITHAGMNSLLEAAFRGKPLITIPLFADQYINAKNSARLGLAVMISRTDISRSHLIPALHQLLKDDSAVARKASLAADVLKGRDEEYRQAALHWARLLCKYGPMDHLQLPTLKLNFFQVYSLDCLGFVLLVFSLLILVVYYLMRCFKNVLHKFARTRKSQKKE